MIKGLLLIAFGFLFIWMGVKGWRARHEDRISLIEAAVLRVTGDEPLPLSRWDRAMAAAQPILMLLFAPFLIGVGVMFVFL